MNLNTFILKKSTKPKTNSSYCFLTSLLTKWTKIYLQESTESLRFSIPATSVGELARGRGMALRVNFHYWVEFISLPGMQRKLEKLFFFFKYDYKYVKQVICMYRKANSAEAPKIKRNYLLIPCFSFPGFLPKQ